MPRDDWNKETQKLKGSQQAKIQKKELQEYLDRTKDHSKKMRVGYLSVIAAYSELFDAPSGHKAARLKMTPEYVKAFQEAVRLDIEDEVAVAPLDHQLAEILRQTCPQNLEGVALYTKNTLTKCRYDRSKQTISFDAEAFLKHCGQEEIQPPAWAQEFEESKKAENMRRGKTDHPAIKQYYDNPRGKE